MKMDKVSRQAFDDEVSRLYTEEGLGSCRIATRLQASPWQVKDALRRSKVVMRAPGSYAIRTHPLNQGAFSLLTQESAYWVGFLMADGSIVGRNQDVLKVSLSLRDRHHLVKLNSFLQGGGRRIGDDGQSCWVTFVSKDLTKDLARWGVLPRKTFTAEPLNGVQKRTSFWRGLFDGDGNIAKRDGHCTLSTASPAIHHHYRHFLISLGLPEPTLYQPPGEAVMQLHSDVKPSRQLLQNIYPEDASWYLDRKFLRARQLLG